jgi:glycosyltransferase involved in cell wall biosynthesis
VGKTVREDEVQAAEDAPAQPIAIAFVGAFGLEGDGPENPAYSPAGHLLQERILHGLESAGADISAVFSVRTVPSYPRQRLLFGPGEQPVGGRFRARLLPFVNLGPVKTLTTSVTLVPELLRWAWRNRGRPRAVLLYNVNIPPGIVGLLASRLSGTRIFAIVADIQVPGSGFYADTFLRRADYRVQTRTLPLLDGLIVLTKRMAADFAPGTPWLLMEGGVPEEAVAGPLPASKEKEPGAPVVFMYSGTLTDLKGIPLLLAGFERARGQHLRLWIAGGGPLRAQVEAAAARDPRIRFFGSLPHAEVLRAYEDVDVLVNPHSTRHVTARYLFPSKLLEYLAMGRPVITTCSTPEVREEYGDVAYVMDKEDPAELAALFERIGGMTPGDRRERGALGRARVAERKTWPRQGRRMLDFIAGIVRGERAAPARTRDERNMERSAVRARDFLQGT